LKINIIWYIFMKMLSN